MSVTKKIILGLFILFLGVIFFVGYDFYKNAKTPLSNNLFNVVPPNAAIIYQLQSFEQTFQKLKSTNIIWEELINNTQQIKLINSRLNYLDSIFKKPEITQLFLAHPIVASLHLSGANGFNFVFYTSPKFNVSEIDFIQTLKNSLNVNPTSRNYNGVNIYSLALKNHDNLYFAYYKETFAFSFSPVLLEEVVRQIDAKNSLMDQKSFIKILSTSGIAQDGNLFINQQYFPKLLKQFTQLDLHPFLDDFVNYASWSELDVNIKPNALMLNGFTYADDSNNYFLNLFKNQKSQEINIYEMLPSNTAFFKFYGLSNAKSFFKNRKLLLKTKNKIFKYNQYCDNYFKKYQIDLEASFVSHIINNVSYFITESATENIENNKFAVFKCDNIEQTKDDLKNIALKLDSNHLFSSNFNDNEIGQLNIKNCFPNLIESSFINIDNPFYTFVDDYIVFANSEEALKDYLKRISNKKTLANDDNFESFKDNLSSNANIFVYCNIARSVSLFTSMANDNIIKDIKDNVPLYRKFEAVAFQVNQKQKNLFYNNIYLKYNPVYKKETRTLWETKLDTTISSQPMLVKNHISNTLEIFVQDDAYKIYLISNTGKILWTKQLQSKILGKVYQVDAFKNNKLQLLFNTENKIFLIDRNGNNVGKYPIILKHKATSGIIPLDYQNNKNYRLLLGCDDNMVYNFDINGDLVNGFDYSKTDSPAKGLIRHFMLSGKDYIIIPLKNGSIKIIQRNGKDRVKLSNKLPIGSNYLRVGSNLSNTFITSIDSLGNIYKLYLNDKLETIPNHKFEGKPVFNYDDINDDKSFDYIFRDKKGLIVEEVTKNELFKFDLPDSTILAPQIFNLQENEKYISLTAGGEVYLINNNGELHKDFPLVGSTLISIGDLNNDNTFNLVVGDKNSIYTYNLH